MNLPEIIERDTVFPKAWVMMVVNCPLCVSLIGQIHARMDAKAVIGLMRLEEKLTKRAMALINRNFSQADALITAIVRHPGSRMLEGEAKRPDIVVFRAPPRR